MKRKPGRRAQAKAGAAGALAGTAVGAAAMWLLSRKLGEFTEFTRGIMKAIEERRG